MSNPTEWNRVFGGEQEGGEAWHDLFNQYFNRYNESDTVDDGTHQVQLTYFKRTSGKFYASGTFDTTLGDMWRIVEDVRSRQSHGEELPGLSTSGKEFIILVDSETHPNGQPQLIIPE